MINSGQNNYHIAGQESTKKMYQNQATADDYIRRRFSLPVWLMLHQREVKILNHLIKQDQIQQILELAPGPARVTRFIKPKFFQQGWGLDSSNQMLGIARSVLGKKWQLSQGDAFELPYSEGKFDLVMTFRFIRHFRLSDRVKLYQEIHKVLKQDGYLVFEALNKNMAAFAFHEAGIGKKNIYDELWTQESLSQELTQNGFEIVKLIPIINHFKFSWKLQELVAKLFSRRLSKYPVTWLCHLIDLFSSSHNYQWEVIARKS